MDFKTSEILSIIPVASTIAWGMEEIGEKAKDRKVATNAQKAFVHFARPEEMSKSRLRISAIPIAGNLYSLAVKIQKARTERKIDDACITIVNERDNKKKVEKSMKYLKKQADKGNSNALLKYADLKIHLAQTDRLTVSEKIPIHKEVFELLEKESDKGDQGATFRLGMIYGYGYPRRDYKICLYKAGEEEGTFQPMMDVDKGIEYFKRLIDEGSRDAYYQLGLLHQFLARADEANSEKHYADAEAVFEAGKDENAWIPNKLRNLRELNTGETNNYEYWKDIYDHRAPRLLSEFE